MPTVAEYLKSQGIADEIAAGLPADVAKALTSYMGTADTKLTEATTATTKAEEARRQAELERKEVAEYVEKYGSDLTKMTSLESTNKALVTYLNDQKAKGFAVPEELLATAPVTPQPKPNGTETMTMDQMLAKLRGEMGLFQATWNDANNEHMRLYNAFIPDRQEVLWEEAARARIAPAEYIAQRYKFKEKRAEVEKVAQEKEIEKRVTARLEEERRKAAEETGSNPNLRSGESSRNSFVPKIKRDDFHKSDGYQPERTRRQRLLERVHADVETNRQNANA